MTASILDGIPGLGEKRKRRLIEEFGGVKKVKLASIVELEAISWLPQPVAEAVYAKTHMRA